MAGLGGGGGGAGAIRAGRSYIEMALNDSAVLRAISRMQQAFAKFGSFVKRMGTSLIFQGVFRAAPLALATKVFADFDDQMRLAGAVAGATTDELARMTEQAKLLGRTTSFTAVQVAAMMVELGRAGFKPDEINEMTAAVLDLSRATGTDAALSAEIMSSTLRQFGLDATQATRVADGLAAAANKSNASVDGLGESLKYAGPIAADLGISLEDTLAILGSLANVGIKGSEAGTGLRRLGIIAAANGEAFAKLGVATKDAGGSLRPLVDILDDLFRATAAMGNADRAAAFNEIFGLLGITSASALSKNTASVRELRDAILAGTGEAARTAQEMDAGIGGAWRRFRSSVEGVAIAIGEALAPALGMISDRLVLVNSLVTKFVNENREAAVAMAGTAIGLIAGGAALFTLGFAASSVGAILGLTLATFGLIKAVVLALLTPLGLVTAALVALGVVWATSTESGKAFVSDLVEAVQGFGAIFQMTWSGIIDALMAGELKLAGEIAMAGLEAVWARAVRGLTEIWVDFKNAVIDGWRTIAKNVEFFVGSIAASYVLVTEGREAADRFVENFAREVAEFELARKRSGRDEIAEARRREQEALDRLHGKTVEANERRLERERMAQEKKELEKAKNQLEQLRGIGSAHKPLVVGSVEGGLAAPTLRQQFGIKPGSFEARQLAAAEKTAVNTAKTFQRISDIARNLRFH